MNKDRKLIVLGSPQGGGGTQVQSDWNETNTSSPAYIKNKPTISDAEIVIKQNNVTKGSFTLNQNGSATINLEGGGGGGSTQVQANWAETDTEAVSYIQNKPSLATVATTGSYNDLTNTPTIPAAQVNSDWNAVSGVAQILNKPTLANVATSGSYNDLTDKPTIPTVPTNVSAFTNDAGYATETYVNTQIGNLPSPMVFKGSLGTGGTITTLPTASSSNEGYTYKVIEDGTYASQSAKVGDVFISNGSAWILVPSGDEPSGTVTSVGVSVPTGLSVSGTPVTSSGTIAISLASGYSIPTTSKQNEWDAKSNFSGSYNDLTDKPTIPAAQIQSDWNQSDNTQLDYIKNKPTIPAAQVNSDWNASTGVAQILNKPSMTTETLTFIDSNNVETTVVVYVQPQS